MLYIALSEGVQYAGVERHPKDQSSRPERHSTSGLESQPSYRSEASQSLQRDSPTISISGNVICNITIHGLALSLTIFRKASGWQHACAACLLCSHLAPEQATESWVHSAVDSPFEPENVLCQSMTLTGICLVTGSIRWPSGDWHGKLFRSMRSKIEAAIDPQEPVGAQPLGNLAQAGQPALPSPALSQAFGVCEAWLRLSQVIIPGNPDNPPHRKE